MAARPVCASCGWRGTAASPARATAAGAKHVCRTEAGVRRATRRFRCGRCALEAVYENAGAAEARHWFKRHSCRKREEAMLRAAIAEEKRALVDRTPKPCLHKMAGHQHGTNAAYHLDGCRCDPCTVAARTYQNHRARMMAYGQWNGYVPGEFVRDHINDLRAYGIGPKRLAEVSGVPHGAISKIVYGVYAPGPAGRNGRGDLVRGPSRRVRRKTAEAIFAIEPVPANLGSRVPDRERTPIARLHLRALVALGWSMSELGRRLEFKYASNFCAIVTTDRTMGRATVDKVEALYTQLSMVLPREDAPTAKISAARSRRYAHERGWVPPLAIDDDDPLGLLAAAAS